MTTRVKQHRAVTINGPHRLVVVAALVAMIALSGCGSSRSRSPDDARAALRRAGWSVTDGRGMTPISGGRQLGWLDLRRSGCAPVSIQILQDANHAKHEFAAIHTGTPGFTADPAFVGVTIANNLVFASPNGHTPITPGCMDSIRKTIG